MAEVIVVARVVNVALFPSLQLKFHLILVSFHGRHLIDSIDNRVAFLLIESINRLNQLHLVLGFDKLDAQVACRAFLASIILGSVRLQ